MAGSVVLSADAAKIQGPNAKREGGADKYISWWTNANTSIVWTANVEKPGQYRVEMEYSLVGDNTGTPLNVLVADHSLKAIPKGVGEFGSYVHGQIGEVGIDKPGKCEVRLKSSENAREFVLNVRSVSLVPKDSPTDAVDISANPIKPAGDGTIRLPASAVQIDGPSAVLEGDKEKNIGFWKDMGTSLVWSATVATPGKYRVELNYALMKEYEGNRVAVRVDDQTVKAQPKPGKSWADYKQGQAGTVTLEKAGDVQVVVKPVSVLHGFVMNLRSVELIPADKPTKAIDISAPPVKQQANGTVDLNAEAAEIDGEAVRLEGSKQKYLVWWNSFDRLIKWPVKIEKPGTFAVQLSYNLTGDDGSEIEFDLGAQQLAATLQGGGASDNYTTTKIGEITVGEAGESYVTLKSTKAPGGFVMHLRSVSLTPVR